MIEALEGISDGAIAVYAPPFPYTASLNAGDVVSLSPLAQAKILEQLAVNRSGIVDQLDVLEDNQDDFDIDVAIGITNVHERGGE